MASLQGIVPKRFIPKTPDHPLCTNTEETVTKAWPGSLGEISTSRQKSRHLLLVVSLQGTPPPDNVKKKLPRLKGGTQTCVPKPPTRCRASLAPVKTGNNTKRKRHLSGPLKVLFCPNPETNPTGHSQTRPPGLPKFRTLVPIQRLHERQGDEDGQPGQAEAETHQQTWRQIGKRIDPSSRKPEAGTLQAWWGVGGGGEFGKRKTGLPLVEPKVDDRAFVGAKPFQPKGLRGEFGREKKKVREIDSPFGTKRENIKVLFSANGSDAPAVKRLQATTGKPRLGRSQIHPSLPLGGCQK